MNVLFMSEMFYPHGGGAELATHLYAKLLGEAGFNVIVVTNRFAGEPQVSKNENYTIYRLTLFRGTRGVKYSILRRIDVLFCGFMKKLMRWADVVYVPRFWYSAIPFAKASRKGVIAHVHDYIPICPLTNRYDVVKNATCNRRSAFCSPKCTYSYERIEGRDLAAALKSVFLNSNFGWCFSRLVRLSDAVVCVSKAQKNLIVEKCSHLLHKIHVIYNPLPDISQVALLGDDFGYFGGFSHMKGFYTLRKAAAYVNRVKNQLLKIHATKFSSFNYQFSSVLNQLGIFTYGKLSNNEYGDLYRRIGTVIVPSVWPEPLPYVVTEASINGRLVVASRVGGIPEQVSGCKGVFFFDVEDYKKLAEKILYVKSLSRQTRVDLGMKNRECVMKRFRNEKIIANFISLLMKVSNEAHSTSNN